MVELAYAFAGLAGSKVRMEGNDAQDITAEVPTTTEVLGNVIDIINVQGAVASMNVAFVTTTA
jgi:GTPase involved in cell partitioning and DNA repair